MDLYWIVVEFPRDDRVLTLFYLLKRIVKHYEQRVILRFTFYVLFQKFGQHAGGRTSVRTVHICTDFIRPLLRGWRTANDHFILISQAPVCQKIDDLFLDIERTPVATGMGTAIGWQLAADVAWTASWSIRISSLQVPMYAISARAMEATQQLGQPSNLNLNLYGNAGR